MQHDLWHCLQGSKTRTCQESKQHTQKSCKEKTEEVKDKVKREGGLLVYLLGNQWHRRGCWFESKGSYQWLQRFPSSSSSSFEISSWRWNRPPPTTRSRWHQQRLRFSLLTPFLDCVVKCWTRWRVLLNGLFSCRLGFVSTGPLLIRLVLPNSH